MEAGPAKEMTTQADHSISGSVQADVTLKAVCVLILFSCTFSWSSVTHLVIVLQSNVDNVSIQCTTISTLSLVLVIQSNVDNVKVGSGEGYI